MDVGRFWVGLVSLSVVMHSVAATAEPTAASRSPKGPLCFERKNYELFVSRELTVGGRWDEIPHFPDTRTLPKHDPELAKKVAADGQRCLEQGDAKLASDAFSWAYMLDSTTAYLWNLALVEMKAGRPGAALRHLQQYSRAKDATKENIARVDLLKPRLLPLAVHVHVTAPAGSLVDVFGAIGVAPLADAIPVDPEEPCVVSATKADWKDYWPRTAIFGQANEDVFVTLDPPPPPGAAKPTASSKTQGGATR